MVDNWGGTNIKWDTPSGCKYTSSTLPIMTASGTGLTVCSGTLLSVYGNLTIDNPSANYCEIWLIKDGNWVSTLASGGMYGTSFGFSAASASYTITESGKYQMDAVFKVPGDERTFSSSLHAPITINVFSAASDPTVSINHSECYYTGNNGTCNSGGGGVCGFTKNTLVKAHIEFRVQGGSENGIPYIVGLQSAILGSYTTVKTQSAGTLGIGLWWVDIDYTFPGATPLIGNEYRMYLSYKTIDGNTHITYTAGTVLYEASVLLPEQTCPSGYAPDGYGGCDPTGDVITPPIVTIPGSTSKPVAGLTAYPQSGDAPLVVTFTETTVGTVTQWFWLFGDGESRETSPGSVSVPSRTLTHTYDLPGNYTVTYSVSNANGDSTVIIPITVTKSSVATITPKVCTGCVTGVTKCNTITGVCDLVTPAATGCPVCTGGTICNPATKKCVSTGSAGTGGGTGGTGGTGGNGGGTGGGTGGTGGTGGGADTATSCDGMNRNGALDPTCIIEKGNEMYLYAAVGAIVLLLLLKKK
jgi:PKD repeat protein